LIEKLFQNATYVVAQNERRTCLCCECFP